MQNDIIAILAILCVVAYYIIDSKVEDLRYSNKKIFYIGNCISFTFLILGLMLVMYVALK